MSLRAGAKAFIPGGSKLRAPSKKSLNKNAAVFIPSIPPQNGAPAEEEPVLNGVEDEPEPEPETTTTTTTTNSKTIQYTRDQLLALRHVTPPESELLRIRAAIHAIMGNIDMTSPGRTMPRGGGRSIKRGTGGKGPRPGGRKPESPLMDIEVKDLDKTENRYVIKKDVPPDEKLIRDLTSILNKLTPDNFERLLEKIVLLKIDTPARLRDAVDAVFEKALSEPAFSPTYAEFSRHLAQKLPKLTDGGEEVQFKRVLLNKCQSEFEKERSRTSSQDAEGGAAAEKRRMLAAIRFIGELYARSMLSSSIIKHCIEILLGDPDSPEEEKIEALCKLLTTSGKVYDEKNPENQAFLDEQFAKLTPLTKKKKGLVSRLRFMIQDLIDLRSHKWIDRRAPTVAQKKLTEIHQEFSKGRAGGAKKPAKPATPAKDAEEWETVGKRSKPRNELASPKARATTSTPRTASSRAQGNPKTTDAALHPSLQRTPLAAGSRNVFEGLDEDDNDGEPDKKKKEKPKKEKESSSKPKKEPPPKGEKPDPEAYDRKLSGLFAEYFSNKDLKDAADNVTELKTLFEPFASEKKEFGLHLIISKGVFDVMERKKEQQELLAQLLVKIADEDILSKEHISDGFTEVLNLAEDMLVDIPKFLDYVGFILGRCLLNSAVDFDYLTSEGTSALTPENRTKLATIVLNNMKQESAEKLGTLYQEAEFDFTPLLPEDTSLEAFFKAQGLEVLLDGASS